MDWGADWGAIEARRKAVGLSRAEMCRRAGISESTVFYGLRNGTPPSSVVAKAVTGVLDAASDNRGAA